ISLHSGRDLPISLAPKKIKSYFIHGSVEECLTHFHKKIMRAKSFFFWVVLCVSAWLSHTAAAQTYRLTDLGALLGTNSYAYGINNQGQVVGYWNTTSNGVHAFLYSG